MANGIGGEVCWLCPTLDQTNPYDDLSPEGNNGTKVGTAISVVSDTGSGGTHAFNFPNTGGGTYPDYIDFSSIGITSSDSYTVSMWIYAYDTGGAAIMLYAGEVTNGRRFAYLQGQPYDNFFCGISTDPLETGEMYEEQWQHVLFTYDRSNSGHTELWLDGSKESDTKDSGTNSYGNTDLFLGRYFYEGLIDDFRVFDSVLGSSDIALLASERGYEAAATGVYNPFANEIFSPGQRIIR